MVTLMYMYSRVFSSPHGSVASAPPLSPTEDKSPARGWMSGKKAKKSAQQTAVSRQNCGTLTKMPNVLLVDLKY